MPIEFKKISKALKERIIIAGLRRKFVNLWGHAKAYLFLSLIAIFGRLQSYSKVSQLLQHSIPK